MRPPCPIRPPSRWDDAQAMHLRTRVLAPYRIRPPSHAEAWNGEAINNQYTQLGTCILGPILSAAHTRSPISIVSVDCKIAAIARAVLSMRMHTPPRVSQLQDRARCAQHAHAHTTRVSQLQDASMLLWAFKWGFGSDFVYAFAKANACCVELTIAQIARQTTTRRRARVCVYALAIQRWQHNPAPATAPQLPRNLYVSIPAQ